MRRKPKARAATVVTRLIHYRKGARPVRRPDRLAREEPLEIRVRGKSIVVTMRTPGHDAELAAGILLSEGIVREGREVALVAHCPGTETPENILNVFLDPAVKVDLARLTRHVFTSASCGLCGKTSIDAVNRQFSPVISRIQVATQTLAGLPVQMRKAQASFAATGGLHAAAIFNAAGRMIVLREDVGRHNAVDKVLGYGLLNNELPFDAHILLVSGRVSFEIMQKALSAKVPIVCAVSAPSSLSVDFARESGQTLVGFLRGNQMNVYAGAERIR